MSHRLGRGCAILIRTVSGAQAAASAMVVSEKPSRARLIRAGVGIADGQRGRTRHRPGAALARPRASPLDQIQRKARPVERNVGFEGFGNCRARRRARRIRH